MALQNAPQNCMFSKQPVSCFQLNRAIYINSRGGHFVKYLPKNGWFLETARFKWLEIYTLILGGCFMKRSLKMGWFRETSCFRFEVGFTKVSPDMEDSMKQFISSDHRSIYTDWRVSFYKLPHLKCMISWNSLLQIFGGILWNDPQSGWHHERGFFKWIDILKNAF